MLDFLLRIHLSMPQSQSVLFTVHLRGRAKYSVVNLYFLFHKFLQIVDLLISGHVHFPLRQSDTFWKVSAHDICWPRKRNQTEFMSLTRVWQSLLLLKMHIYVVIWWIFQPQRYSCFISIFILLPHKIEVGLKNDLFFFAHNHSEVSRYGHFLKYLVCDSVFALYILPAIDV